MSPSVLMIILGLCTNTSIGMLFAAGIPAGLLIVVLFIAYVTIRAWLRPDLAPPVPVEERPFGASGWSRCAPSSCRSS